jgi:hypothetical protein
MEESTVIVTRPFSFNCPSMAAVRICNLLHHPLSKYQNLKDVGTMKIVR